MMSSALRRRALHQRPGLGGDPHVIGAGLGDSAGRGLSVERLQGLALRPVIRRAVTPPGGVMSRRGRMGRRS